MLEKIEGILRIRLKFEKKSLIWLLLGTIAALVLCYTSGYPWWAVALFVPAYLLIKCLDIRLGAELNFVWVALELAAGAAFSIYSMQYLILPPELFVKTTAVKWTWNILTALAIYCLVQIFVNHTAFTAAFTHFVLLVVAFVDYFVYSFRGNELSYADLRSAGTGLSVAANYQFNLEPRCGYVILWAILFIAFMRKIDISVEHKWKVRGTLFVAAVACGLYVAAQTENINTETWEQKGSYRNGYLLNFCLQIRDSFVSAPDDYSLDAIRELEEMYAQENAEDASEETKKPTVICIMSESFADLSVVGDFETNVELTPFLDSLQENTIRGYALSSVYSAKTPNSEWEFMTGNSMAFLPQGSVVYQQFIDDEPNSLVSTMSNYGYTCVAMHPYYETGWSRNSIYPTMGFDEMYFIDDFDQTKLMRKYITDEEFYDKIIERYEKSPDSENLFIMGISMQNHGGYGDTYDNFEQYVYKTGTSYTDANQYLQLVHNSDQALEKLITYFSQVEDPVEIVFFGDHLPGLNSRFYALLNGKGLSGLTLEELENVYTVPFFIWTNYDTEEENVEITSLNYLSSMALERAGLELPAYNRFLEDLREVIPAINSQGYYSAADGEYHYLEDAEGEEAEWINRYHILQYNNMFDEKNRSSLFFPYLQD